VPVTFAPFPAADEEGGLERSLAAVRTALARGDAGAVVVEPILGRGGCVVPPDGFLGALRGLADDAGVVLIIDEIWTGIGRTGALLASEGVVPDVLCLGKALGGGVPISACVGRADVMAAWGGHGGTRIHTGTHFGSPPACAAALATLEAVTGGGFAARARDLGGVWREELRRAARGRAMVRGRGLMVGIELPRGRDALSVARRLLRTGFIVLTGGVAGSTLTLSPPLTIEPGLLTAFAAALEAALRDGLDAASGDSEG
jgi:4-aminobutyrate aminotransferase/(S)-3-amino-2-methylpropionate transaminase